MEIVENGLGSYLSISITRSREKYRKHPVANTGMPEIGPRGHARKK